MTRLWRSVATVAVMVVGLVGATSTPALAARDCQVYRFKTTISPGANPQPRLDVCVWSSVSYNRSYIRVIENNYMGPMIKIIVSSGNSNIKSTHFGLGTGSSNNSITTYATGLGRAMHAEMRYGVFSSGRVTFFAPD